MTDPNHITRQQLADVSHERDLLRAAISDRDALINCCSKAFDSCTGMGSQKARIEWYADHLGPTKEALRRHFEEVK